MEWQPRGGLSEAERAETFGIMREYQVWKERLIIVAVVLVCQVIVMATRFLNRRLSPR